MKKALKKELAALDRDQLIQLILGLYSTRKEAKAYFDFFLNPDVDKLYETYSKAIEKELSRYKRYKSTARISRIRANIKEFTSFDPGVEVVVNLMIYTIKAAIVNELRRDFPRTLELGIGKLCKECLEYADANGVYSHAHKMLELALNGESGFLPFINLLRQHVEWPPIIKPNRLR